MKLVNLIFCLLCTYRLIAQTNFIQTSFIQNIQLDQLEIQSGQLLSNHIQIRPIDVYRLKNQLLQLKADSALVDASVINALLRDQLYVAYMENDSNYQLTFKRAKPILKYFYRDGNHLLSINKPDFHITLDPLLHFEAGALNSNLLFINRRGLRIQGGIDQKLFFQSELLETQLSVPKYVEDYIDLYQSLPGAGFFKNFSSKLLKTDRAYDYLLAEASVDFNFSKSISFSFGHGKHFIGNGMRSLFLSDFASPKFFLKINTQVWKLHYQNLFTELSAESIGQDGNRLLAKKYMAAHYVSIHLTKNWNAGIFESVVFSRNKGFELQYLNPVILYRFVEQALGSPDNVFIGFNSSLLFKKKFSIYAQIFFDEFVFSEFFKGNGWWGNKYGFQLGGKYIHAFGVKNFHVQLEYNQVRPYTYTFRDSVSNYSHYHQALAHPLGANFKEWIMRLNYLPDSRWSLSSQLILYKKGLDQHGMNYGGNILLDYTTRQSDYGNTTTQGLTQQVLSTSLNISYKLFYKTWLDVNLNQRMVKTGEFQKSDFWFTTGFRMNLDRLRFDF